MPPACRCTLRVLLWGAILSAAACQPTTLEGGSCSEDDDCPSGSTCVFDLTRTTSYCAQRCQRDTDCPEYQSCRLGSDRPESGAIPLQICIDRVRSCPAEADAKPEELCNGLDDDCDGVIDGAGCALVSRCLDDAACGAFVCQAPENQPDALCAPRNTGATVRDFEVCTSDDQCRNSLCETGLCSPFCRGRFGDCPGDLFCARAVGSKSRPFHNSCQRPCLASRNCDAPQECVWRDVFQAGMNHAFVCSIPAPERKPLGAACTRNSVEGDDECAHGLCFGRVCTRPCGGAGSDCSDVGPDFECGRSVDLFYGDQEFVADLCVRRI